MSSHSTGINVERRIAAIGESLQAAFRSDAGNEVGWEQGVGEVLPQAGIRFDRAWPEAFDPPPLAGATRASVVARVPDLADRNAVRVLRQYEASGRVVLRNCPAYVRTWMAGEHDQT